MLVCDHVGYTFHRYKPFLVYNIWKRVGVETEQVYGRYINIYCTVLCKSFGPLRSVRLLFATALVSLASTSFCQKCYAFFFGLLGIYVIG